MTEESGARLSIQFVLNVLRQHEIELDKSISELNILTERVKILTEKIQQITDNIEFARVKNNPKL